MENQQPEEDLGAPPYEACCIRDYDWEMVQYYRRFPSPIVDHFMAQIRKNAKHHGYLIISCGPTADSCRTFYIHESDWIKETEEKCE